MLLQANRLINKVWLLFLKNSGMPRLFVHGQPALITPYISGCQLLLKRFRAHSYSPMRPVRLETGWKSRGL